jgi:putative flippase GtrA
MKSKLKDLLRKPGYRYVIIGGSVYLIELLVIVLAQSMGASATVAVGISFWVGLLISFVLQKLVTFGDKRMQHKILLHQILAFCLLVAFNFGFTVMATETRNLYTKIIHAAKNKQKKL